MSWWMDYYSDVDSVDIERISSWFADDMRLQFANWEPLAGKENVRGFFANFLSRIESLSHEFGRVVENEEEVFCDCVVQYNLKNGGVVRVKAASYAQRRDGMLCELRVYLDPTELLAATAA